MSSSSFIRSLKPQEHERLQELNDEIQADPERKRKVEENFAKMKRMFTEKRNSMPENERDRIPDVEVMFDEKHPEFDKKYAVEDAYNENFA